MIQRLPIALAHIKEGNTSEKLLYRTRQIIYFFYQAKEIPRNVFNKIKIQWIYKT